MRTATFTFYPDLDGFLPPPWRTGPFACDFEPGQSLKHLVEAAGVPHTELGRVEVNGQPAALDQLLADGDQVQVWRATAQDGMRPACLRFVLDNHLGRLAAYLRMLGFDSLYRNDYDDLELAETSAAEERILLTRDRRLLMRKVVRYGYCLRSLDSRQQLREVVARYQLNRQAAPFQRCLRCNSPLEPVEKEAILHQLQPLTIQYYHSFHRCPACGQIYWKGSHYEQMQTLVQQISGGGHA